MGNPGSRHASPACSRRITNGSPTVLVPCTWKSNSRAISTTVLSTGATRFDGSPFGAFGHHGLASIFGTDIGFDRAHQFEASFVVGFRTSSSPRLCGEDGFLLLKSRYGSISKTKGQLYRIVWIHEGHVNGGRFHLSFSAALTRDHHYRASHPPCRLLVGTWVPVRRAGLIEAFVLPRFSGRA